MNTKEIGETEKSVNGNGLAAGNGRHHPATPEGIGTIRYGHSNGRGRGVFAEKVFEDGDLIERSPVIVVPEGEWCKILGTVLESYCYGWGENSEHYAIALGFGSLYNHSYQPNARYERNPKELTLEFIAIKRIEPGEEITVNYNGFASDNSPVWFEVVS